MKRLSQLSQDQKSQLGAAKSEIGLKDTELEKLRLLSQNQKTQLINTMARAMSTMSELKLNQNQEMQLCAANSEIASMNQELKRLQQLCQNQQIYAESKIESKNIQIEKLQILSKNRVFVLYTTTWAKKMSGSSLSARQIN